MREGPRTSVRQVKGQRSKVKSPVQVKSQNGRSGGGRRLAGVPVSGYRMTSRGGAHGVAAHPAAALRAAPYSRPDVRTRLTTHQLEETEKCSLRETPTTRPLPTTPTVQAKASKNSRMDVAQPVQAALPAARQVVRSRPAVAVARLPVAAGHLLAAMTHLVVAPTQSSAAMARSPVAAARWAVAAAKSGAATYHLF